MFIRQSRSFRLSAISAATAVAFMVSSLLAWNPSARAEEDLLAPMETSDLGADSIPTQNPALPTADSMNSNPQANEAPRTAEKSAKKKSGAKSKKVKASKKKSSKSGKKSKKAKKGKSAKQKTKKKSRA
jgi:hypothetical protein